jgi:glycosyltransferase involved in cell wall biosynthesis
MKVDVIIPTYNRSSTLKRAIDSVLNQTYKGFHLYIIDDGSTDNTALLMQEYKSDENISYIKQKNKGVSAARNLGISLSNNPWVAFLDSDDEWLPHKLKKQIEIINSKPEAVLIHGEEQWVRNGKRINPKKIHQKFGGQIFEKCLPLCLISPSAAMIKRDVLLEMENFDEDFIVCEDYDLWLKITSLYEVEFISDPILIKYGGHEDQLSAKYFAMDYYRIKSMDKILSIRNLSIDLEEKVNQEIIRKGDILLAGYKKHNNLKDYEEVLNLVEKARQNLQA